MRQSTIASGCIVIRPKQLKPHETALSLLVGRGHIGNDQRTLATAVLLAFKALTSRIGG